MRWPRGPELCRLPHTGLEKRMKKRELGCLDPRPYVPAFLTWGAGETIFSCDANTCVPLFTFGTRQSWDKRNKIRSPIPEQENDTSRWILRNTYVCADIFTRDLTRCSRAPPKNCGCTSGSRGQLYLSFLAGPAVLLCRSGRGAQALPESLAGQELHPSLAALVALELPPPPWGTESWRCSKTSSLQERAGTGYRAPRDAE